MGIFWRNLAGLICALFLLVCVYSGAAGSGERQAENTLKNYDKLASAQASDYGFVHNISLRTQPATPSIREFSRRAPWLEGAFDGGGKADISVERIESYTDKNFLDKIIDAQNLMIVEFWAEWCKPCKKLAPTIVELAKEFEGKVTVGKVNIEKNKKTPYRYDVDAIPTILFFKDGRVVAKHVGLKPKMELRRLIESHL